MQNITPIDLRTMRRMLGFEMGELAEILGTDYHEVKSLERMRSHYIHLGHHKLLTELLDQVDAQIDNDLAGEAPRFIFTYPHMDVLKVMAPEFEWMLSVNVHEMYAARLAAEWRMDGHAPNIVEIIPAQYQRFLEGISEQDSHDNRVRWAEEHMKVIQYRDHMPTNPSERRALAV